jgi:nucleotide-binding universal stress UspA family protein
MATRVVVGVDGTASSIAALRWSVTEARLHHARLHVVSDLPDGVLRERLPADAPEFRSAPAGGKAAEALVASLDVDSLLVLGLPRRGRIASLFSRSTLDRCLGCVSCPVVVVPSQASTAGQPAVQGPVVVGVDGSPGSRLALRAGALDARLRGVPLLAVHVLYADYVLNSPSPRSRGRRRAAAGFWAEVDTMERAEACLQAVVDDELGDVSEARVAPVTLAGQPGQVLLDETARASLVCLGARGIGRSLSAFVGSVAERVLANPECPVLLVPPTAVTESTASAGAGPVGAFPETNGRAPQAAGGVVAARSATSTSEGTPKRTSTSW